MRRALDISKIFTFEKLWEIVYSLRNMLAIEADNLQDKFISTNAQQVIDCLLIIHGNNFSLIYPHCQVYETRTQNLDFLLL